MEDRVMKKQQYISPAMEIFECNTCQRLLFGSEVDKIYTEGLFDNAVLPEEENIFDEDLKSIWNNAW